MGPKWPWFYHVSLAFDCIGHESTGQLLNNGWPWIRSQLGLIFLLPVSVHICQHCRSEAVKNSCFSTEIRPWNETMKYEVGMPSANWPCHFQGVRECPICLAANSGWMWHLQKWYILTSDKAKASMIVIGAVNPLLLGLINLFYL